MVCLTEMRRCILQFAVMFAMVGLADNVLCSVNCLVASFDPASQNGSTEEDHGCHHDDNPAAPASAPETCLQAQIVTHESVRTLMPLPEFATFHAAVREVASLWVDFHPARSAESTAPPPLSPDILSTTILRV